MNDAVTTILYERCPDCDTAARWHYSRQICDACGRGKPAVGLAVVSNAALDVLRERARQVSGEGWDAAHDDAHTLGELALAAACYAINPTSVLARREPAPYRLRESWHGWLRWPWAVTWWKPRDRRSNLVRAAALLIAEIERVDRESARAEAALANPYRYGGSP
jgi:hypothetical protein